MCLEALGDYLVSFPEQARVAYKKGLAGATLPVWSWAAVGMQKQNLKVTQMFRAAGIRSSLGAELSARRAGRSWGGRWDPGQGHSRARPIPVLAWGRSVAGKCHLIMLPLCSLTAMPEGDMKIRASGPHAAIGLPQSPTGLEPCASGALPALDPPLPVQLCARQCSEAWQWAALGTALRGGQHCPVGLLGTLALCCVLVDKGKLCVRHSARIWHSLTMANCSKHFSSDCQQALLAMGLGEIPPAGGAEQGVGQQGPMPKPSLEICAPAAEHMTPEQTFPAPDCTSPWAGGLNLKRRWKMEGSAGANPTSQHSACTASLS